MEENNNNHNGMVPQAPHPGSFLSFGAVFFGGLGLVGDFFLVLIWNLPAGIFLGLLGIACAVLSRQGKPFTQQAQLGLILSIISVVCGLMVAISIIFIYDIMDTNTALGEYFRQGLEAATRNLVPSVPAGE